MKNYDGPSIFNKKGLEDKQKTQNQSRKSINFLSSNFKPNSKPSERKDSLSFKDDYELPQNLNSRNKAEDEFKTYLEKKPRKVNSIKKSSIPTTKNADSSNPSTFRVKEVPSPMFGFTKEQKKRMEKRKNSVKKPALNYTKVKQELKKNSEDFILLEGYATLELEQGWENKQSKDFLSKRPVKKNGLNKNLSGIIEEDYNELKSKKRNVSGLFTNYYNEINN